jgi:hypothetical protein
MRNNLINRLTKLAAPIIVLGIVLLSIPADSYGQRGGGRGGGGGGGGRRTSVVVGAAAKGTVGDGKVGDGVRSDRVGDGKVGDGVRGEIGDGVIGDGNRPGYVGNIQHPGLAGAAIARRRMPIGTVVGYLPPDCEMTFILEMEYYYCSGQYYQSMGTDTEPMYVAAEPYIPQY